MADLRTGPAPPTDGSDDVTVAPSGDRQRRRLGRARRAIREAGLGLITAGVIILLFVTYQLWGTSIAERNSQAKLKRTFSQELSQSPLGTQAQRPAASPTTSPGSVADTPAVGAAASGPPGGGAIDHLVIPRIGVDKFVVQGIAEGDLRRGPGHYPQTVMPGEQGNAAIAGHRTTYGAPFYRLNELRPGDDLFITNTAGRTFDYRVRQTSVVSPKDVAVLNPSADARLTLTTCNPRFSAATRLVVVAGLAGNPVPSPVTTVPPSPASSTSVVARAPTSVETLGRGDHGAWSAALAYGAGVVVLWVAARVMINRTRRWRRLAAYVGGIAVCLLPLWFCFENAVRLLPQNI